MSNAGMGGMYQGGYPQGGAYRSVMSADAGIQDAEGPDRYPASMYRGNQYDAVNQSVINQLSNMGGSALRSY